MNQKESEQEGPTFIRALMPEASEEELLEATDNVKRYLAVVLRIHPRLAAEGCNTKPDEQDT